MAQWRSHNRFDKGYVFVKTRSFVNRILKRQVRKERALAGQGAKSGSPDLSQRPVVPTTPDYQYELNRARARRDEMGVLRPTAHVGAQWGLALSGGGIRSATFCLGAMQGMAKSTAPIDVDASTSGQSLLRQFDYLSTVSGGGYIGGFFSSLFVPGRLDRPPQPSQAVSGAPVAYVALSDKEIADQAYRVFSEDPPTRLRHDTTYDRQTPGRAALAWLRENGRYLVPSGAGDYAYAMAVHLRNWCATHYVLGTVFLCIFALLAALRAFAVHTCLEEVSGLKSCAKPACFTATFERNALDSVTLALDRSDWIWWSPVWWLLLPMFVLWVVPAGVAFWLTHPRSRGSVAGKAPRWSKAACVCLGLGMMSSIAFAILSSKKFADWQPVITVLGVVGLLSLIGTAWFVITACLVNAKWFVEKFKIGNTITTQRVVLTRRLRDGLVAAAVVAAIALIDTTAQTLYLQRSNWSLFSPAIGGGALAWLARKIANASSERKVPTWLARIPLSVMAGIGGAILAFLVAVMWALAVQWIKWKGVLPDAKVFDSSITHWPVLIVTILTFLFALVLAIATGSFPGFLNLSTLQGLYSARITRAYLGASNSLRFEGDNEHLRSVAEPAPGDHMTLEDLYRNPYAPMHIINTCMNLTSDPAEQLVQRDRKGKPLAVIPGGLSYDKETHPLPAVNGAGETGAPLTVGEWIAVSGASLTTGLGRSTSLGFSLLLGLANVRLGRWWPSRIHWNALKIFDRSFRAAFKTQIYLINEILGRFYGVRREWQYLTDGGHFENTAAYELLRRERNIKVIVICDCGADPDYEFADLANLTRLVRIDFGIELEEDQTISRDPALTTVFGRTTEFRRRTSGTLPEHDKCAILLNVYHTNLGPMLAGTPRAETPDARIIVLKPRLLLDSNADLCQYQATHPAFPQEPTSDQFFDESQWESYRRLGMEIAMRVFPGPTATQAYRDAFARIFA